MRVKCPLKCEYYSDEYYDDDLLTKPQYLELMGNLLNPETQRQSLDILLADHAKCPPPKGLNEAWTSLCQLYMEEFYTQRGIPFDSEFLTVFSKEFLAEVIRDSKSIANFLLCTCNLPSIIWPLLPNFGTVDILYELLRYDFLHPDAEQGHDRKLTYNEYRQEIDKDAQKQGKHILAHFCIDNGLAEKLLPLFETPGEDTIIAIRLIAKFGFHYFAFPELLPLLDIIMTWANGCEDTTLVVESLDCVICFSVASSESLNWLLTKQTFLAPFTENPGAFPPEIQNVILESLCEYDGFFFRVDDIPEPVMLATINCLRWFVHNGTLDQRTSALRGLSYASSSEKIAAFYLGEIIPELMTLLGGGAEWIIQTCAMAVILEVFSNVDEESQAQFVSLGIIDTAMDCVDSMFYEIPEEFLDFLSKLLNLAKDQGPWQELVIPVLENEELYDLLSDYQDCDAERFNSPRIDAKCVVDSINELRELLDV